MMRQNGNPLRFGVREGLLYALLPMLVAVANGASLLPGVIAGGLFNPDSYMRLLRIQETLRQHSPAYFVDRDGSGAGALLHWSHLLDSLICLLAAPFAPLLAQPAALHLVAASIGPLSMAALGLSLAWAIAPVADRSWLWMAPAVAALSPAILAYGMPGVAHHHVLLVVVAIMTAGYALRAALGIADPASGLAMGAWAGVGIWLSPESMPLSLMAFAGVWLVWVLAPDRLHIGPLIRSAGLAFLLVVAGAFAVDPPYAGYAAPEIDRISVVYLVLAIAVCVVACASLAIDRVWPAGLAQTMDAEPAPTRPWGALWDPLISPRTFATPMRIAAALAVPAVCLAIWIGLFPSVIRGPDGLMTAQDANDFLSGINEMKPVAGLGDALAVLLAGSVAAAWLLLHAMRRQSILLGYVALCAVVLTVLGAVHMRFAAYACAAGAALLPILVARCTAYFADRPRQVAALARVSLLALFALGPRAGGLPGLFTTARAATGAPSNCSVSNLHGVLAPYRNQVVLGHVDDTPELLYRTDVQTVASLYHRNVPAFLLWRAAWSSPPADTTPEAIRRTRASILLFCRDEWGPPFVGNTLRARLGRGEVPHWLHEVAEDPQSGNLIYEVMR